MDTTTMSTVVALLIALSVAAERLVEIVKGMIPALNTHNDKSPEWEGRRKALLQLLAVVAGIATAWVSAPVIKEIVPGDWGNWPGILALGLLASGGSGFWNSVQTYVLMLKDLKKVEVNKARAE